MKKVLVCGAGGFIGGHLVTRLKNQGCWVRGVDIKEHEYKKTDADEFFVLDLRNKENVKKSLNIGNNQTFDEVYQLAADMGGAGYIFTGENDANVMYNSCSINLHVVKTCAEFYNMPKVFYSSSACVYPKHNQLDPDNPNYVEDSAYPANPDNEYGWEKLFSERLFMSFYRNYGLEVRIARFHNTFGPYSAWNNGKEKAPAAICRKVSEMKNGETIEIWGDGQQMRSFLYIDECLEGIQRLMKSEYRFPLNIGSDEMITINQLTNIVGEIAEKKIEKRHIDGPTGMRERSSDNTLIKEILGWSPTTKLIDGIKETYKWIDEEVKKQRQEKYNKVQNS